MFKYDNSIKNSGTQKIIDSLKNNRGIVIGKQSAERILYLIKQRHQIVDSVEVSGKDSQNGREVQQILNIKELGAILKIYV